ncbi:NAD-dependent epimerase/dehydratase family protein, partial [bacterium]|nr:NAD-dependent epimerase/dehydratase family protein [bacterium]
MILVTGGTGFLGSHVVSALLEKGERVRALVRRPRPDLKARGIEVAIGDVVEAGSLDAAFRGVTRVIHLAGRVDRAPEAADELYLVHVDGARNVLRAAARAKVSRFVHVSTSGTTAVSDSPDPIKDERAPDAVEVVRAWPYYLSKIFAERLALEAASLGVRLESGERAKVPVVVVSPSLLLGPGDER